jgi:FMN phosphatase YigB (HAD superfamily)
LDDSLENTQAAATLGMHTIHVSDPNRAIQDARMLESKT